MIYSDTIQREELAKKIANLEWDLVHISNEETKSVRASQLKQCKNELNRLTAVGTVGGDAHE